MSPLSLLLLLAIQTPQADSLTLKRTFGAEEQVTYSVWADASELGVVEPITGKLTLKVGKPAKEGKTEVTIKTSEFQHLPVEITESLTTKADEHGALWDISTGHETFPYLALTAASFLPAVEMKPGAIETVSWKGATTKITGKITFKGLEEKTFAVYTFDLKAEDEGGSQGLVGESYFDLATGQLVKSKFTYEVAEVKVPFKFTRDEPKDKKAGSKR